MRRGETMRKREDRRAVEISPKLQIEVIIKTLKDNLQVVQREAGAGSIHWVVCQCDTCKTQKKQSPSEPKQEPTKHHTTSIVLHYHMQQGCPWIQAGWHAGWRC